MIKKTAMFLIFLLCFSNLQLSAEQYVTLRSGNTAKVVEILDGESIKVKVVETSEIALVRLLGVDASGYDAAITYLTNFILGKNVNLTFDNNVPKIINNRWNNMYVTCDGVLVNSEILERGFARTNADYKAASNYSTFLLNERNAKAGHIGIWNTDNSYTYNNYTGDAININTASSTKIREFGKDISSTLANRITSYRSKNPFARVEDLKFVDGFTKDIFDKNRNLFTVSTNVDRASMDELLSLKNFTQSDVDRIIEYRNRNHISSVLELYNRDLISESKYDANKMFLSTSDTYVINYAVPDSVANINTATTSQLMSAGLSSSDANALVKYRTNYSYKTIGELAKVSGVNLTNTEINELADNLKVFTNVNTASLSELRSLFGNKYTTNYAEKIHSARPFRTFSELLNYIPDSIYDTIIPYIYLESFYFDTININLATKEQMRNIGMSENQVDSLYAKRKAMTEPEDIPTNLNKFKDKMALYTNINTATITELGSLSTNMTSSLITDIMNYREDQPFGSMEELRVFFKDKGNERIYDDIKNFIVLR